jgi:predicted nucleic acid-binding protein
MPRYTYDTNIIKGYKVERLPENFYMSTVVLSELMTGAVDQSEFDGYQETWRRHSKDGTLIIPTAADWLMASKVLYWLAQERRRQGGGRAPRWSPSAKQELAMDALIATSARREGVTVVTNDTDFDAIQYYCKTLKLERGSDFFKR